MDPMRLDTNHSEYYRQTLNADPLPRKIRLGSFNIRYDPSSPVRPIRRFLDTFTSSYGGGKTHKPDGPQWGERRWELRREKVVDQVLFHELDLIGFQEVLDHQYQDLQVLLGEEFGHVGVGRDDGQRRGEAVPIFYRKSRFSLISYTHKWLSPTPEIPGSVGWDAGQPRMVTIARFVDLQRPSATNRVIVGNTHWDDRGLEARTQSARLILDLIEHESKTETSGIDPVVILLGDLNSPAEEAGYRVLTGGKYAGQGKVGNEKSFWDSRHEIATRTTKLAGPGALSHAYGPLNTFTGFVPSDTAQVIDFILVYDNSAFVAPHIGSPWAEMVAEETPEEKARILDADNADEVMAAIPASDHNSPPASPDSAATQPLFDPGTQGAMRERQVKWKVARYGVVPNFSEDVGGKRGGAEDGLIVSDHRLIVVALEEVVA
ncbi:endonuclease/exonuclease/phosphatase family protein [Sporobolomyces koalae]|uniref:endonuclease/exonuclease/phosphatase family protein n=1 Tax=Sporobolomyces koalae TaxID=500713 RepID=UPI00317DEDFE